MKNLFIFFIRHHVLLLFLFLQGFCVSLIVQHNEPQKSNFISTVNIIFSKAFNINQAFTQYFHLVEINNELAEQNAILLKNQVYSKIDQSIIEHDTNTVSLIADSLNQQYQYMVAKVVNNSTNRANNYITLNKGWREGVEPNMAVISTSGIVGIVLNVSQNYSTVMSVLHSQFRISARFKRSHYFGSAFWNGKNYRHVSLTEIPFHVKFKIGDTLVTNEFSNIYPGEIMIGTVKEFNKTDNDNFYGITLNLSTDFKKLDNVFVVKNLYKKERETLESLSK